MIKTLALLPLDVFPFFHCWIFYWHPSVSLDFHLFLKNFANHDYCFNNSWIRVLLTFLPLDACYFSHFDVDGETIVVELSYYGFLEIFFSLVRPTSLHNESDQSFVKFIARVNFGMWEWNVLLKPAKMLRDKSQGNFGIKLTEIKQKQNKSWCFFVKFHYFTHELIANFLLVESESKWFTTIMSDKHESKRTCRITCGVTWRFSA